MSRELQVGVVSVIAGMALAVLSVVIPPVKDDQVSSLLFVVPFALIVGAVLFAWLLPWAKRTANSRSNRPAKAGMVVSVLGFLSIVAFWSGLPVILGAGGVTLGRMGRDHAAEAGRGGLGLAAVVIGALAIILSIAAFVGDQLA